MIIHSSVEITIKFAVGKKYCIARIKFSQGDDSDEVIRRFIKSECIPHYLESSFLSGVNGILLETRKDADVQTQAVLDLESTLDSARLLASQYKNSCHDWNDNYDTEENDRLTFASAYRNIIKDDNWCKHLQKLENCYAIAMKQLIQSRDDAILSLRNRQAEEMERERDNPARISVIVQKHIKEMDNLEHVWAVEIQEAKVTQRQEYKDFVQNFTKNGIMEPLSNSQKFEERDKNVSNSNHCLSPVQP